MTNGILADLPPPPPRMVLSAIGIAICVVVGWVASPVHQARWLSELFGLAFLLALVSDLAIAWARSRGFILLAVVAEVAILGAAAFLIDAEAIVFLFLVLAIWRLS